MKDPVQQIKNYWISDTSFVSLLGMLVFIVFLMPVLIEQGMASIVFMNTLFLALYFIGIFSSKEQWKIYLASALFIIHVVLLIIRFDDTPNQYYLEILAVTTGQSITGNVVLVNNDHDYAVYIYYSMTSLTTVGYGDIYPDGMPDRMVSVMLSAIGILYPAVIIARLVTVNNTGTRQ